MKPFRRLLLPACFASVAFAQDLSNTITPRPDPRQVPVPKIQTALGNLPSVDQLPVRKEMPDPFIMDDGTRVTTKEQWAKRREEIRRTLEYYHIGRMPPAPGNVKGTEVSSQLLAGGKVTYRLIKLTFGPEEKLSLHIGIYAPTGAGPLPTVIQPGSNPPGAPLLPRFPQGPGQARGWDVLLPVDTLKAMVAQAEARGIPGRPFRDLTQDPERVAQTNPALQRGYAYVTFNHNDCAEDTTLRMPDGSFAFRTSRFFPAYPGYDWGVIGGWMWGTMRIVDYLQNDPAVDKTKLIITGTSRLGKAAMYTGAFDDRIALVAPGASSGLGSPAFRFSGEGRGGHEGLTIIVRKYPNWFSPHLHQFWGQEDKLPYDAHWFTALTAPRPWIALEGTRDPNVAQKGVKQTWLHSLPAYKFFGAPDKVGVYWADRLHGFSDTDWDGLLAFADKHLLGKQVTRAFDLFPATGEVNPLPDPFSSAQR